MNTHAEYRRHSHQPSHQLDQRQGQPPPAAPADAGHDLDGAASHLARHRDPSLALPAGAQLPGVGGVAWVRPTELAAYAAPLIGRGIDAQAELIRRARRAPASTARAIPRLLPHTTAADAPTPLPGSPPTPPPLPPPTPPPAPLVPDTEGLSL